MLLLLLLLLRRLRLRSARSVNASTVVINARTRRQLVALACAAGGRASVSMLTVARPACLEPSWSWEVPGAKVFHR